ncbi:helix-turn-helix transcriptional regulator [Chachezhania sediminis]|uniref:helix-turn-helix transcriptional regulator n=1 Tax=Chachezhania sediminis TaxID=2599291 RepID=UPI00131D9513|nr:metalloregulator ArsR/SmtB family transcription factor [Chachezhania sediminis]
MSSKSLENYAWSPRGPADRILMQLKMHGPQTSGQTGERLGITGEAARQQLVKLAEDGLVAEERRSQGRGRPSVYWHLTDAGQARFPDTHAALTVEILASIEAVLGTEALDRVIAAREARTQAQYRDALSGCASLKERVEKLANLRTAEGYMARAEDGADGAMLLIENHCPICAAATQCRGFCRAELAVFQNVLGDGAEVERVEYLLGDGRRCTYLIRTAVG